MFTEDFKNFTPKKNSLTLILGQPFSKKSEVPQKLFPDISNACVIGTSSIQDLNYLKRIQELKNLRPKSWVSLDAPDHLENVILEISTMHDLIVIDSLNQWLTEIVVSKWKEKTLPQWEDELKTKQKILEKSFQIIQEKKNNFQIVLISSEISSSLSPPHTLSKFLRQHISLWNNWAAELSDNVCYMTAGIPRWIK